MSDAYTNTIIVADTTKVLPELIKVGKQYQVIIADPPYNIGKDFGNDAEVMPIGDYVEWAESWIRDCLELLTDDGLLYLYGFPEIIARISVCFPIHEQRWLVWHYTNKTVPSLKFWQRSHETILCLWKPNMPRTDLEIDQIREPYTKSFLKNAAGKERKDTPSRYGSVGKITIYNAHENGALPRDVIKIPALAGGAGHAERWFMCRTCGSQIYPPADLSAHREHDILKHPTQKPMELTRRLILSRINGKDGKVLVPFVGSGSECIVAQALGVKYLGIEMNPEFADFAVKWLEYERKDQITLQLFERAAKVWNKKCTD
jgi:site-specific DNA-methyltransferase (adenine-specific)